MPDTVEAVVGGDVATALLDVTIDGSLPQLSGDVGGTFTTDHQLVGTVNLTGDLIFDGATLVARPGVTVNANGFQILFQNGAVADWQGTVKSGWVEWGDPVTGWQVGDRLAVSPLAAGDLFVHYTTWTGDWADVSPSTDTLTDGTPVKAEVANLDRDITVSNVSRVMFHMGAGVSTLKHVAVVDSGVDAQLGFYPIHFHFNYDTVRGSIVEGVVVENGQNHAFVPHGSHGVVFRDVAAVNTRGNPYWWDLPVDGDDSNNSDDTVWEHALALRVVKASDDHGKRLSAFTLGAGVGNSCVDCRASAVLGGSDSVSGFIWPEFTGGGGAEGVWVFTDAVAHNNQESGIFVWQNSARAHVIEDTFLYRNGEHGINHGAYTNTYTYRRVRSIDNEQGGHVHAGGRTSSSPLRFIEVESNTPWQIGTHAQPDRPVEYIRVGFTSVEFWEGDENSINTFYDSGLTPDDFALNVIHPDTTISIYENGVLVHSWQNGTWNG